MSASKTIRKIDHMRILFDNIEDYKCTWGTDDTILLLETAVEVMKEEYVKPPKGILSVNKKATK